MNKTSPAAIARVRRWQANNQERVRAVRRKYYDRNKYEVLDRNFQRAYGITLAEKQRIIEEQGNKCACCHEPFGAEQRTHLDHCHKTNKVRGVLCGGCNTGLGHFQDSIARLKNAVAYLENHRG